MTGELKRCPFCGGLARVYRFSNHIALGGSYYVMCEKCLTSSDNYNTEQKAIEAWNRRV